MINRRTKKFAAVAMGLSLIAASCGGDDETTTEASTEESAETPAETEAPAEESSSEEAPVETEPAPEESATEEAPTETEAPSAEPQMRVTYTLADTAVWEDGSPITAADFECLWRATIGTPEALSTVGYDQIVSITGEGNQVVVDFARNYAPWKTLFAGLLQASMHEDCNDVSTDFDDVYAYGGNPYRMTEWTAEQIVFETNPGYIGPNVPKTPKIVIVPAEDGATLLKAGTVDFIFPQFFAGIEDELVDPNVATQRASGASFEGFYFQQDDACEPTDNRSCAFKDDAFRQAFSMSIDLDAVYEQIYAPFAAGDPLLTCGPMYPGRYCDGVFVDTYDPEGAAAVLEAAGWTLNADGFWANPDGEVPEVKWMVNTGNTRRENTQAFLIPQFAAAGFNVVASNCEALPCVFETRLPALDYDLGMYINGVAPDPAYLSTYHCNQIPSEDNDFQGQNSGGWCNEEASASLDAADQELDETVREGLIKEVLQAMKDDSMMLPTLAFPNLGAWRTDKVDGVTNNLANYWTFQDWWNFEDLDGDGQVVIGAEQFPGADCKNPITGCANSTWFVTTAAYPNFPSAYWTTNDLTFTPGEILAGEATVEQL